MKEKFITIQNLIENFYKDQEQKAQASNVEKQVSFSESVKANIPVSQEEPDTKPAEISIKKQEAQVD